MKIGLPISTRLVDSPLRYRLMIAATNAAGSVLLF
jgi:hypothetical protein